MITSGNVHLKDAHKTPQFWLIWVVLCLNVSAGIGVLAMASPMLQEIFGGSLIGHPETRLLGARCRPEDRDRYDRGGLRRPALAVQYRRALSSGPRCRTRSAARSPISSSSASASCSTRSRPRSPIWARRRLFVAAFCVILSMYGGGFATVPAYLADMFGTQFVGAIHGRLLTAWSTAGVVGPLLVGYIRGRADSGGCRKGARL